MTPDPRYLLPDPVETLRAAEVLVAEGFTVLPYVSADPTLCKRLKEAGCATVMPLGSWIGSNQGLRTRDALAIFVEQSLVPVVVDAGLGAPSHAAEAMELGADAVLVNTAIATAGEPAAMAVAFRQAVAAGRGRFRTAPAGLRPRLRPAAVRAAARLARRRHHAIHKGAAGAARRAGTAGRHQHVLRILHRAWRLRGAQRRRTTVRC